MSADISLILFAKGLRVARDNEEFQRIWPKGDVFDDPRLAKTVARFERLEEWPDIVARLCRLYPPQVASQLCLLIDRDTVSVTVARRIRDTHRRPTVMLAVIVSPVDWRNSDGVIALVNEIARAAHETIEHEVEKYEEDPPVYARRLRQMNNEDGVQIRVGRESLESDVEFLMHEICRYQGIQGASTTTFAPLGANIIIGTEFEASSLAQEHQIDGYFIPGGHQLHVLTDNVRPWPARQAEQELKPPVRDADDVTADQIATTTEADAQKGSESLPRDVDRIIKAASNIESAIRENSAAQAKRNEYEERKLNVIETAIDGFFGYIERAFDYFLGSNNKREKK